jgi:hypothetical protein
MSNSSGGDVIGCLDATAGKAEKYGYAYSR